MFRSNLSFRQNAVSAFAVCIVAGAACVVGCGSDSKPVSAPPPSGTAPPPVAAPAAPQVDTLKPTGIDSFRASLVQSEAQVDKTVAALDNLTNPSQTNIQAAYNTYCDELANMDNQAQRMKTQADTMRASRDTYFSDWEQKASDIDNPTIRASAEARRKRLRDAHEQIISTSGEARDAYVPFMKDLQDIKKYLSADLSKNSVADLGDAAKSVHASGTVVRQKIDAVIATLDSVKNGT